MISGTFFSDNCDKLNEKKTHSLFDCQGYLRSRSLKNILSVFKSLNNLLKLKAKKPGLLDPMKQEGRTTDILNDLNIEYHVNCKTTITKEGKKILHIPDLIKIASLSKKILNWNNMRLALRDNYLLLKMKNYHREKLLLSQYCLKKFILRFFCFVF